MIDRERSHTRPGINGPELRHVGKFIHDKIFKFIHKFTINTQKGSRHLIGHHVTFDVNINHQNTTE